MSLNIDPSRLTPEEFYQYVSDMIDTGYKELDKYEYLMPDMLTVGVHHFNLDLSKTRGWNNRILGMLQEARQVNSHVLSSQKANWRLFEIAKAQYMARARTEKLFAPGSDATERQQQARLLCQEEEQRAEKWDLLKEELKGYIETLEHKQKDLQQAKNDLRAQLWAVRVHGVLGELSREAQSDNTSILNLRANNYQNGNHLPEITPGPQVDPAIDMLLQEKGES